MYMHVFEHTHKHTHTGGREERDEGRKRYAWTRFHANPFSAIVLGVEFGLASLF